MTERFTDSVEEGAADFAIADLSMTSARYIRDGKIGSTFFNTISKSYRHDLWKNFNTVFFLTGITLIPPFNPNVMREVIRYENFVVMIPV